MERVDEATDGARARAPVGPAAPSIDEVAARYGGRIYAMAYHLTGDPHDAADLAQEVFIRVHRNIDRYRPGSFEGWLYRITKNLFLDQVRARRRQATDHLGEEEWQHPVSTDPEPPDVAERHQLERRLVEALGALRPSFRLAVVLADMEGLTYEEIADATGWPLGTVRSRIHRGRRDLRDALAEDEPGRA